MKQKILYVDIPFTNKQDTESERSMFLWNILSTNYDTDLLLIRHPKLLTRQIDKPEGINQIYALATSDSGFLQAKEVYHFSKENLDTFNQILSSKHYDTILFRQSRCVELIYAAEQILPECNLVVDLDYIFSRQIERSYENVHKKKISKLHPELIKQRKLENALFRQPYNFLFSHNQDLLSAKACVIDEAASGNFILIPNSQPITDEDVAESNSFESGELQKKEKFILFFGNLETPANQEAFLLIAREIYPRISKSLQAQDIKIYIAGNSKTAVYDQFSGGRIKLMKPEEDISRLIRACLFILLPYPQSPESNREILMAAKYKKAVLTTHFGQEQIDFPTDDLAIEDDFDSMSKRIMQLLCSPEITSEMGNALFDKVSEFYDPETIKANLLAVLNKDIKQPSVISNNSRLRIAVITEVFDPDSCGNDYIIYNQIIRLSNQFDVTVFCPGTKSNVGLVKTANYTVYRMRSILKSNQDKFTYNTKSLCPALFNILLKEDFDLIQLFQGIRYNNYIAMLASRFLATPIILCSTGIIDYQSIFLKTQSINADILQTYRFSSLEKLFLKQLDYILTVSEKEYARLRKINNRIELIPVPVSLPPDDNLQSMRDTYNIGENEFVIVCFLPLIQFNGQDIALQAFNRALPGMPDSRLILLSDCEAQPDFLDKLESYIESESLQDEIIIHELIDKSDISAWVSIANLCIIPSRFLIGDSTTINSWAHGIPVLQSDAVDPNPIIDGYNGYLFCSEDMEDLLLQMQKAYNNKDKLSALAKQGNNAIKDLNTFDELIKRNTKIIEQLTT